MTLARCISGFEKRFEEAREKSKAANKKSAQGGLKFEAEATGWLQVGVEMDP